MSSDPVLIAYGVKRSTTRRRNIWHRIGEAYAHDEGAGLTIVLHAAPRDGRVILLERDYADDRRLQREARRFQKKEVLIGKRHD